MAVESLDKDLIEGEFSRRVGFLSLECSGLNGTAID